MKHQWSEPEALELVRQLVARELIQGKSTPGDEDDLVRTGCIDSMGWVAILSAIEETAGIRNFGSAWPEDRPQSIRALSEALQASVAEGRALTEERQESQRAVGDGSTVLLAGWGSALGSVSVHIEEVERECGLAPGTLRDGAGIESVSRASDAETELVLGRKAAEAALGLATVDPETVDLVVATSATFLAFPSLSASLHSLLLLQESCAVIDVGGACVGLLHALATAKALLSSSRRRVALVVASEVHSRRLSSPQVPGEFRGLFGDGACAFILVRSEPDQKRSLFEVGDFIWGCSGTFSSALRLSLTNAGEIEIGFKGEQLAGAAVSTLDRILGQLEQASGKTRSEVSYFALHEPNPRVIQILAQRAKIPLDKIWLVSRTAGNLGSATSGVSLCVALDSARVNPGGVRPLIFLAAVGPGLIWAGSWLQ